MIARFALLAPACRVPNFLLDGKFRRNLPEETNRFQAVAPGVCWANPLIEHCNIKVVTPVPTAKALQVCLF